MQDQTNSTRVPDTGSVSSRRQDGPDDGCGESRVSGRDLIGTVQSADGPTSPCDIETAGERYIAQRRALGRKKSTLEDYESTLRVHLAPFFGRRSLGEIDVSLVEAFIFAKLAEGKAPKSVRNYVGLLHSILNHGVKRGWCESNSAALVERPRAASDPDIRFLTLDELEAILAATAATPLGLVDRLVFLTAAMTGMRRGEVVAVRWHDIDWNARLIRVRRNFTRGEFGTPKSRRSSRAVPLAARLADELWAHHEQTHYGGASDLVFTHPLTGNVLDPSKLRKRFQACARRAGVRPARFHDLRHTFGTQMAGAGAPLRAIQEWLGHADLRTTLIYADYALDPNQGARYAERAFGHPVIQTPRLGESEVMRLDQVKTMRGKGPP
jgi:integrase